MLAEAIPLALAASIYPTALVVLVVLLRDDPVRPKAVAFLAGAATTTFVTGLIALVVFRESGANDYSHQNRSFSGATYIVLGLALLFVASRLWRRRQADSEPSGPEAPGGDAAGSKKPSLTNRLIARAENPRFAYFLGALLYTPSVLYISSVKVVVDDDISLAAGAVTVIFLGALVLAMTEVAVAMVLISPQSTRSRLEAVNTFFSEHGGAILLAFTVVAGCALIVQGLVRL